MFLSIFIYVGSCSLTEFHTKYYYNLIILLHLAYLVVFIINVS